jgi:hypothetical protein
MITKWTRRSAGFVFSAGRSLLARAGTVRSGRATARRRGRSMVRGRRRPFPAGAPRRTSGAGPPGESPTPADASWHAPDLAAKADLARDTHARAPHHIRRDSTPTAEGR